MHPAFDACELAADAIEVGRIAAPWGIKGWFKVHAHSASPEALFSSKRWYLLPPDRLNPKVTTPFSGCVKIKIRQTKEQGGGIVAEADGIDDRNLTEQLQGCRIYVSRESFPSTDEGEYYWVDLIGLSVVNRQGVALGTVQELLATGPQTVLVLQPPEGDVRKERMIPFVDHFVDKVDLAARLITVDWLLEYDLD